MLTGKEIMHNVLAHKKANRTPYWLMGLEYSNNDLAHRLDLYYQNDSWRKQLRSCINGAHVGFILETPKNGFVRDTFGVPLKVGNISHNVDFLIKEPDLSGFQWPEPNDMVNLDDIVKQMNAHKDKFQMYGLAMGLFERGWYLRGIENLLMDMIVEEQFVEDLLDGIMQVHIKFIDLLIDNTPIDAIYGGDDVCDQRGVIMGLERWQKLFKPRLKQLISKAHQRGFPYILHSCGNVLPIVDDLIEIGLDGLESLQPETMDLAALKQKAKGKLALIGGMGVQSVLYNGTIEEIKSETQNLIRIMGESGGYVLAPSKEMEFESTENAVAFIESLIEVSNNP